MPKFYAELTRVISDPAIKVVPGNSWRPAAPPSRLDTEMFRVLEATQRRLYPGAITVPGMVTGATDLAQLRAKGVQTYGIGRSSMRMNSPSMAGTATWSAYRKTRCMDWFGLSGIPCTGLPPATEALRKNATQQLLKNRRYQLVPWCHFRVN